MALSANTPLTFIRGELSEAPVKGSTTIYDGAILGDDGSGYARGLVAGDPFIGHAMEYIDNSSGSDGDLSVKRMRGRYRLKVTITSVAITNVGDQVYASADDTYTLTPGSNTRVGVVERYVTTNTAIVEFQTTETTSMVSDITALLSDLALNSYSDFNVYVSDTVANKSDIVVLKSDMVAEKSDAAVFKSDTTALLSSLVVNDSDTDTNTSDIVVIKSDLTAAKSDITVLESDRTAQASDITSNDSDIVVLKSDVAAALSSITVNVSDINAEESNIVVHESDLRVAISDAQVALGEGDWVNVSDALVTVTEILTAFSDALG